MEKGSQDSDLNTLNFINLVLKINMEYSSYIIFSKFGSLWVSFVNLVDETNISLCYRRQKSWTQECLF